jgi:transcriptional regulator with XRE-family HTH domain
MNKDWLEGYKSKIDQGVLDKERLIVELTETIARLMQEQGMSKSDLADALGHKPAFVTKLLSGKNNFTVATLSKIFLALKAQLHFAYSTKKVGARISCVDEIDVVNKSSSSLVLSRSVGRSVRPGYQNVQDLAQVFKITRAA